MRSERLRWSVLVGFTAAWVVACSTRLESPARTVGDVPPRSTSAPVDPPMTPERDAGAKRSEPSPRLTSPLEPSVDVRDRDAGASSNDGGPASKEPPRGPPDGGPDGGPPPFGSAEPPPLRNDTLRTPPKVQPVIPDAGARPL